MLILLQQFGGRLPADAAQFDLMTAHMRRLGHIVERTPNNVAQLMRLQDRSHGGGSHHYTESFMTQDGSWHQDSWNQGPASSAPPRAYHSDLAPGSALNGNPWDNQPEGTYVASEQSSETDTATESDDGTEVFNTPELSGLSPSQIDEKLYWGYQRAKKM